MKVYPGRQGSEEVTNRKAAWGTGDLGFVTNLVTHSNVEGVVRGLSSLLWAYLTGRL